MRRFFKVLVVLTVVGAGFIGGFTADVLQRAPHNPQGAALSLRMLPANLALLLRSAPARAADASLSPVETYFTVMNTIRGDYYGPTPPPAATKLTYTAISGMLKTLNDPYTSFWTPEEYRKQMEETKGDFVGIGAILGMTKEKQVFIEEPIENSPASKEGVLPGDIIVKVDGKPILGMDLDKVVERIRGEKGTPVTLSLLRKGKVLDVTITRAQVYSPVLRYRMQDEQAGIGYIRLLGFNEQADQRFAGAARARGPGMRALTCLRGNPGGLLNIAQDVASRFIDKGPLVWVQEKNGKKVSLDVEPDKHQSRLDRGEYPVVVLVDGASASASEIVAGAIQDYGVGTLVGTTTFGKGLVQTIIPLQNESAVKITTQHYFTPKMHDINRKFDESGKQAQRRHQARHRGGGDGEGSGGPARGDARQPRGRAPDPQRDVQYDPPARKALEVIKEKLAAAGAAVAAQASAR